MSHVVIVPVGKAHVKIEVPGRLPWPPGRTWDPHGDWADDLRTWGTELQRRLDLATPRQLIDEGLGLPLLAHGLPRISQRRMDEPLRVLLVTTDQDVPHAQDTVTLGPVVKALLPEIWKRVADVATCTINGCNPSRLDQIWPAVGEIVDMAVKLAGKNGTVDLLDAGGTPQLRSALSFRLNLGRAAGLDTQTWLVEVQKPDPTAHPPPPDTCTFEEEISFSLLSAQQAKQQIDTFHFGVAAEVLHLVDAKWTEMAERICQAGAAVLAIDFQHAAKILAKLESTNDIDAIRQSVDVLVVSADGARFPDSLVRVIEVLISILQIRLDDDIASALGVIHLISELLALVPWEEVLPGERCSPGAFTERAQNGRYGIYTDEDFARSYPDIEIPTPDPQGLLQLCGTEPDRELGRSIRGGRSTDKVIAKFGDLGRQLGPCILKATIPNRNIQPCLQLCEFKVTDTNVSERGRLALSFQRSSIVQLRHSTPSGHFLTVPDPSKLVDEWNKTPKGWDTVWPLVEVAQNIPGAMRAVLTAIAAPDRIHQPSRLLQDIKQAALARLP